MASGSELKTLGKVSSKDSGHRSSKLSEVIKTTELGTLDAKRSLDVKKSSLREQKVKKTTNYVSVTKQSRQKNVVLTEDYFGVLYNDRGLAEKVKRFTWKNSNDIEVQVISYGARITSIKLPNRKGVIDDIVVGCRDLAGYLHYGDFHLGATIGRVTNKVEDSTFQIDGRQYWLQANDGKHHKDGGNRGLDKIVWKPYVSGNKVILSHTSPHGDEGYPGDLLIRISYELSAKNEFNIVMEAVTTKPTIINLSNLTYFNLAGHFAGPEELYRHTITINSNCYTETMENGLPTGDIVNTVFTRNDFQIPTVLKTRVGVEPNDGYDQNFCINRGMDQENCFVARALHAPTGRILEIYSNQYGVNFTTANHFGSGLLNIPVKVQEVSTTSIEAPTNIYVLLDAIHRKLLDCEYNAVDCYEEIKDLLRKIQRCKFDDVSLENLNQPTDMSHPDNEFILKVSPVEISYLKRIQNLAKLVNSATSCATLQKIIADIFDTAKAMDQVVLLNAGSEKSESKLGSIKSSTSPGHKANGNLKQHLSVKSQDKKKEDSSLKSQDKKTIDEKDSLIESQENKDTNGKDLSNQNGALKQQERRASDSLASSEKIIKEQLLDVPGSDSLLRKDEEVEANFKEDSERERKGMIREYNIIPSFYKDGRMHGKNGIVYKRHGAMAFQTQNYPNATYHKDFPNCVLKPGETYTHTIVYKFWVQSGLPTMWNKRNCL